jgi:pyroglutamyl-peptidase
MTILLTGFTPFGGLTTNPSQGIVEALAARGAADLVAEVLPTEFAAAGRRVGELIRQLRPRAVVCLGVGRDRDAVCLERVALNLDDCEEPDNAGHAPAGQLIAPDGPLAYWSTLPLERMRATLRQRGVRVRISNHAGTYVCNHVFYLARHELETLGSRAPCGFIHVPLPAGEADPADAARPLPSLPHLVEAVACCLEVVRKAAAET